MKIKRMFLCTSIVFIATLFARAQGSFKNLDFERAKPGTTMPGFVNASNALPDWTTTIGGIQQTEIGFDAEGAGAPEVNLIGTGALFGLAPIDGNYSVLLQGSGVSATPAISQTGLIPAGTQSLSFEAISGAGPLDFLIGTQLVPFTAIGSGPNYTLYGANISAWANQTEQIAFSAEEYSQLNNWEIDDISFSQTAVPEPGIVALSAMGGLLLGVRKWLARH